MAEREHSLFLPALSLVLTLSLSLVPLPHAISSFRPDWVAVVLLYWSLTAPRRFSLLTAFWMGIVLDTLSGSLLGQHALALLVIVYVAERLHLRIRVFPMSQLGHPVLDRRRRRPDRATVGTLGAAARGHARVARVARGIR